MKNIFRFSILSLIGCGLVLAYMAITAPLYEKYKIDDAYDCLLNKKNGQVSCFIPKTEDFTDGFVVLNYRNGTFSFMKMTEKQEISFFPIFK